MQFKSDGRTRFRTVFGTQRWASTTLHHYYYYHHHHHYYYGQVLYGILEFNVPLDTVWVISETTDRQNLSAMTRIIALTCVNGRAARINWTFIHSLNAKIYTKCLEQRSSCTAVQRETSRLSEP